MLILMFVLLGLSLGSFTNALVWRIYMQDKGQSMTSKKDLSIITGRSMCAHCRHTLGALDLIPVFSWLWLRGRCRYCKKPISDTPLPELIMPLLFVLSYIFWPFDFSTRGTVQFIVWLVLLVGFVALSIYDMRWRLLPNRIVFVLVVVVVLQLILEIFLGGGMERLIGAFWGLVFGSGTFWLLFKLSSGRLIGGGDVKLGLVYGLLLGGPINSLLCIFLASTLGTIVALPMVAMGRAGKMSKIPFGPYLITATIIVYLFGASIVHWYRQLAGI